MILKRLSTRSCVCSVCRPDRPHTSVEEERWKAGVDKKSVGAHMGLARPTFPCSRRTIFSGSFTTALHHLPGSLQIP
jgi:hypothetical protein